MKTSLLSFVAALSLLTTMSAQAAPLAKSSTTPIRVEAARDEPRHLSRAERARYEAAQRRQQLAQQRRLAAERARLEQERKLAATRARQEQLRQRPDDRREYSYNRH